MNECERDALTDALHPEFGTEWREPDGIIWQQIQQAWEEAHAVFCPRGDGRHGLDVCSTHLRPGDRWRLR